MSDYEKQNVYKVYNHIADWFEEARDKPVLGFVERPYLDMVAEALPKNASILDLGCGTGFPIADYFMKLGHNVTGIDGSEVMIQKCQKRYPTGDWRLEDMREVDLSRKFDAIIAWDSFFHLPHNDQITMFDVFEKHANAGAMLLFTAGPKHDEVIGQMQGYDFYHTSLAEEEYRKLLKQHDFEVVLYKAEDKDCGDHTVWVAKHNDSKT
jgi:2-polyprenyl-3-methyl-5-hydroxy-6-metoxy-1,4-benzoquinol methylase